MFLICSSDVITGSNSSMNVSISVDLSVHLVSHKLDSLYLRKFGQYSRSSLSIVMALYSTSHFYARFVEFLFQIEFSNSKYYLFLFLRYRLKMVSLILVVDLTKVVQITHTEQIHACLY